MIPLLGLAAWLGFRGAARLRSRAGPHSPRRPGSAWLLIAAAVLLALIVRLPFLNSALGLMSSDDAVPALMAKHISEGRTPPVYYYGQLYMGAVSEHAQAVVYKIFGFSIIGFKLSMLMFFLGFIWIQFRLIEQAFDRFFPYRLEAENSTGPENLIFPSWEMRPGGAAAGLTACWAPCGLSTRSASRAGMLWCAGSPARFFPGCCGRPSLRMFRNSR